MREITGQNNSKYEDFSHSDICVLVTKIFKSLANVNLEFMIEYSMSRKMPYNLGNGCVFKFPAVNSTYSEINSFNSFRKIFIAE